MRDFPNAFDDALDEQTGVRVVWLLVADFGPDVDPLLLWTGLGTLEIDDDTYEGGAHLIQVTEGQESADGEPGNLEFALPSKQLEAAGGPEAVRDFIADALAARAGGYVRWYEAHLSPAGGLTEEPVPMWGGRTSSIRIAEQAAAEDGGRGIIVTVTAGDDAAPADRAVMYRMTAASQKAFDPDDRGLEYLPHLADFKEKWGGLYYSRVQE